MVSPQTCQKQLLKNVMMMISPPSAASNNNNHRHHPHRHRQRPLPHHRQRPLPHHRQRPLYHHRQRPFSHHHQRPLPHQLTNHVKVKVMMVSSMSISAKKTRIEKHIGLDVEYIKTDTDNSSTLEYLPVCRDWQYNKSAQLGLSVQIYGLRHKNYRYHTSP